MNKLVTKQDTEAPILYFDMDGVLCDFFSEVMTRISIGLERDPEAEIGRYRAKGCAMIHDYFGISKSEFWRLVKQDIEFWSGLKPFQDMVEVWKELCGKYTCKILTSPSAHPSCIPGKLKWLSTWLKVDTNNVIFATDKWQLAGSRRLLIDDLPGQCSNFEAAGGRALLLPSNWNSDFQDRKSLVLDWVSKL